MTQPVAFTCNGESIALDIEDGETLLTVLRERLGITSAKDGCAPQGQCGCCTVFVDGAPRVACVTPAVRVHDRVVTTIEGVDAERVVPIVEQFVAHGASQCGFCTPGIVLRSLALVESDRPPTRVDMDRALAAHLCRCTGWNSILDAITEAAAVRTGSQPSSPLERSMDAASAQAELEGHALQRVGADVVRGHGGFADDAAPRDALVAVPKPPGSVAESVRAAGLDWVVGESLHAARVAAEKVQGRRTTMAVVAPLACPPSDGINAVQLATSWNEPAYLEPDASWCVPGGEPAATLGNGGAFGGKIDSVVAIAARDLADHFAKPVRTLFAREDVVRYGAKRAPIAATARFDGAVLSICGLGPLDLAVGPSPYALRTDVAWERVDIKGPPVSESLRAPWAEACVLTEGALDAAGVDRRTIADALALTVLLDVCVRSPQDAYVGARCVIDDRGALQRVELRIACGEVLDEVVARSYSTGAAHMALGWVLSEGLAVDTQTGDIHDLTIRSFGIVRPKHMPTIDVVFVNDERPARSCSDAVFAASAAALWNAVARSEGERPTQFPALESRTSRAIRK